MTDTDRPREPIRTLEIGDFLAQAHAYPVRSIIERHIDQIKVAAAGGKPDQEPTDRDMLRVCFWLLRAIGVSMPWNEEDGLDVARFDQVANAIVPPWRQCIGAVIGLEFTPSNEDAGEPDAA